MKKIVCVFLVISGLSAITSRISCQEVTCKKGLFDDAPKLCVDACAQAVGTGFGTAAVTLAIGTVATGGVSAPVQVAATAAGGTAGFLKLIASQFTNKDKN